MPPAAAPESAAQGKSACAAYIPTYWDKGACRSSMRAAAMQTIGSSWHSKQIAFLSSYVLLMADATARLPSYRITPFTGEIDRRVRHISITKKSKDANIRLCFEVTVRCGKTLDLLTPASLRRDGPVSGTHLQILPLPSQPV